jgi:putative selenium metabolism hydrolase
MEQYQRVCQLAKELLPEAVAFTQRLVRCPSAPGEEKNAADIFIAEMEKIGYDEVFRDDWGNVIGVINGQEPGPTILCNAHMDHVPVGDLSLWEGYDPFGGLVDVVEMDDRYAAKKEMAEVIHGRGTADVKGGMACHIYGGKLLLQLRKEGVKLKGKYIITAVCMEEFGDQVGTIQLIDDTFKKLGWSYDGVISSEASSLGFNLGHRGRVELLVSVHGKIGHASAPWTGINAVCKATKLIDIVTNELPKQFPPEEPDLGPSTICLTVINAIPGELCVVPERCDITFDRRFGPEETPEGCMQEIQEIIDKLSQEDPEFRAEVKISEVVREFYTGKSVTIANKKLSWKLSPEHPFVQAMADGLKAVGQEIQYRHWFGGTDLSKVVADDHKPALGYGAGQEQYTHVPFEVLRTDFMEKVIAGYAAGFLKLMELPKEAFRVD